MSRTIASSRSKASSSSSSSSSAAAADPPGLILPATTTTDSKGRRPKETSSCCVRTIRASFRKPLVLLFAVAVTAAVVCARSLLPVLRRDDYEYGYNHIGSEIIIAEDDDDRSAPKRDDDDDYIPACASSPWKPSEDLVGSCQGSLKPHRIPDDDHHDRGERIRLCAKECCDDDDEDGCVAWQYREDVGCLHGGDVRLGMEKDGPGSWCHDHPPMRWEGQRLPRGGGDDGPDKKEESDACHPERWNPGEQPGQCFGLGDKREEGEASSTSADCRDACCHDANCFAWQFHPTLGCFYNENMHGCTPIEDPVVLRPFVGRRKIRADRTYTGPDDEPWAQQQQQQRRNDGGGDDGNKN